MHRNYWFLLCFFNICIPAGKALVGQHQKLKMRALIQIGFSKTKKEEVLNNAFNILISNICILNFLNLEKVITFIFHIHFVELIAFRHRILCTSKEEVVSEFQVWCKSELYCLYMLDVHWLMSNLLWSCVVK